MPSSAVLVTGGAGYVGSHTCKALAAAGYLPVTYDNLCRGHREFVKWGPLEIGDICDERRIVDVLSTYQPIAVIHFAALALVAESISNPAIYFRTNTNGSHSLVNAMYREGIDRLVVSGTCAVYGTPDEVPITENTPRRPINPYGQSKLEMENILSAASDSHGLNCTVLRYFNASGADPDGEIGELHDPETHLIPNMLAAAADNQPFLLNGQDYPTPDGTCIRDYIHVSDLARAHILALKYLDAQPGNHAFNLGSGTGFSIREVLEVGERITGKKIEVQAAPRRIGDPPILVADISRARKELKWSPNMPLNDQVRDAWRWHQTLRRHQSKV